MQRYVLLKKKSSVLHKTTFGTTIS